MYIRDRDLALAVTRAFACYGFPSDNIVHILVEKDVAMDRRSTGTRAILQVPGDPESRSPDGPGESEMARGALSVMGCEQDGTRDEFRHADRDVGSGFVLRFPRRSGWGAMRLPAAGAEGKLASR